jgi:hypothetical protein
MDEQQRPVSAQTPAGGRARRGRLVARVCAALGLVVLLGPLLVAPYRASVLLLPASSADLDSALAPLRSRALVAAVVKELTVAEQPSRLAAAGAAVRRVLHGLRSPHRWQEDGAIRSVGHEVEELRARLEVEPLGGSHLIEVGLSGSDPAWASEFLDRLTAAYVEQQRTAAAAHTGQDTERDDLLRARLAASETELRELREKIGTYGGEAEEIRQRLIEFDTELARVQVSRVEQEERVAYLQRVPPRVEKHLSPQLLELETKRAEALAHYLPGSKRIKELDEEILRVRNSPAGDPPAAGPTQADAATDLVAARAVLAALRGREKALAQGREEYRQRLVMLEAQGGEVARLEKQVKVDQDAYVASARTTKEPLLAPAAQATLASPSVIAPASVSRELPTAATLALLVGLLAGLALGRGAVTSRGGDDALTVDPVPPEASAPRGRTRRDLRPATGLTALRTLSRAIPVAVAIVLLVVSAEGTPLADFVESGAAHTPAVADDALLEQVGPHLETPSAPPTARPEPVPGGQAAKPAPAREAVVPTGGSILSLIRKLAHKTLTVRQEVEAILQVKHLNPQIFNLDLIRPGDKVILPGCIGCTAGRGREGGA